MALFNRPLTEDEVRAMLESWRATKSLLVPEHMFRELCVTGKSHQFVRYDAKLNRVVLEDPQTFYDFGRTKSPSDSRMMVPK